MNLRSIADLDEVIIDSNLNSYDEDQFENDSSIRELHYPKSPVAPDYTDDFFESDDQLSIAIPKIRSALDRAEFSYDQDFGSVDDMKESVILDKQLDANQSEFSNDQNAESIDDMRESIDISNRQLDIDHCEFSYEQDVYSMGEMKDSVALSNEQLDVDRSELSYDPDMYSTDDIGGGLHDQNYQAVKHSTPNSRSRNRFGGYVARTPIDETEISDSAHQPFLTSLYPQRVTRVMASSLNQALPQPVLLINQNLFVGDNLGNKSQFSSVKVLPVNDAFILNQLKKRNKDTGSIDNDRKGNSNPEKNREKIIHSLEEMLLIAADRVEMRSAAVSQVAGRAIHIPNTDCGLTRSNAGRIMSGPEGSRIYGIPDYDPDYDCAMVMKEEDKIPHLPLPPNTAKPHNDILSSSGPNLKAFAHSLLRSEGKGRKPHTGSVEGSRWDFEKVGNKPPGGIDGLNVHHIPPSSSSSAAIRTTAAVAERPFPEAVSRAPIIHRNAAEMVLDDIKEGKVTADLLRLGVDRDSLARRSEEIHTSFLADLLELCRSRAAGSCSIEDMAMHRALAVHVRDRFLGPGVARGARAGMVATAVEVSLKYPNPSPNPNVPAVGTKGSSLEVKKRVKARKIEGQKDFADKTRKVHRTKISAFSSS